ncbi:MAG: hemerythrin domain-containing protein [Anaerolineae bacterium]
MAISDPIVVLMQEHQEGLKALERMAQAARQLKNGDFSAGAMAQLDEAASFINGEIRQHNEKEENALFPALAQFLPSPGPVDVMLSEHRELWNLEDRLESLLKKPEGLENGIALAETALAIVSLLRGHIDKEDNVLYPMARNFLGSEGLTEVARKMEERGG